MFCGCVINACFNAISLNNALLLVTFMIKKYSTLLIATKHSLTVVFTYCYTVESDEYLFVSKLLKI